MLCRVVKCRLDILEVLKIRYDHPQPVTIHTCPVGQIFIIIYVELKRKIMYWKVCGRKQLWSVLRYYPNVCLVQLRNTMKALSQDIHSLGPDFNLRPLKYEAGVLTSLQQSQ
jgi:hypothetical protein